MKVFNIHILVLATSISSYTSLQAKECKTPLDDVNLGKNFGEQRDQGDAGWCYAYAASALIDYYRFKKFGDKSSFVGENRTSPAYMALLYNEHQTNSQGRQIFEGGTA